MEWHDLDFRIFVDLRNVSFWDIFYMVSLYIYEAF